jgi:hypothetical protein
MLATFVTLTVVVASIILYGLAYLIDQSTDA